MTDEHEEAFKVWLKAVDDIILTEVGVGLEDLPDKCTRDYFEEGWSPKEAATDFLEGYPGEDS
jgi:hypothetical protein